MSVGAAGFLEDFGGSARKIQRSPNIPEARQGFHICSTVAFPRAPKPREGLHNGHPNVFAYRLLPSPLFTCEITCELYTNYVRIIHEFSCVKLCK